MKIIYDILYKNGHVDVIEQKVTEENTEELIRVTELIKTAMEKEGEGYISFGDGDSEGSIIRLPEIVRVKMRYEEESDDQVY